MEDLSEIIRNTVRTVPDFPQPGIEFRDITPVLEDPALSRRILTAFQKAFSETKVDAIVGIESRGFIFGMPLALELGVPFIVVRKKGKLPARTISHRYELEYGSEEMEVHQGAIRKGWNVMVHDDLLATGGSARAASELIRKEGGTVAGYSFLIELGFLGGGKILTDHSENIFTLVRY